MINIKTSAKKVLALIVCFCILSGKSAFAQTESYIQSLTGIIKPKDVCIAVDEKFADPGLWAAVKKNVMVQNLITFEVRFDTTINFFNKSFDCELLADISYKDSNMQEKKISDVKLQIHYDTAKGKTYKGIAYYKFTGGHEVKVIVKSITSKEIDVTKAAFLRVKNQILIDRTYKKRAGDVTASFSSSGLKGANAGTKNNPTSNFGGATDPDNQQLTISWGSEVFEYDNFDLEYTFYDANSYLATQYFHPGNVTQSVLEEAFKNNATRVSVTNPQYVINLVYPAGYVLVRIRSYTYNEVDGEMDREEGAWHYMDDSQGTPKFAVYPVLEHGTDLIGNQDFYLNWQYSAMFAEDGKRKEVVSYFDGGMKSRQSVTISNSDNVSIVAENVLDKQNRPAVSILPVPTTDKTIHYFPAFNRNQAGGIYSYADFNASNICASNAAPMSISYGSSKYYSPSNPFTATSAISKDIPDANGFPFAVTEFTNDQTGRIRRQGGVGPTFQLGGGHETSYYYGKPLQEELDRLFGSEAGAAAHYSKNMVVDANGQVSISYVDIAGKTVATSLAGTSPANLKPLESGNNTVREIKDELVRPQGLVRDADNMKVSFSSTVLVPAAANYSFKYEFSPRSLELIYGFNPEKKVCADCYYDVKLSISNECGEPVPLVYKGNTYNEVLVPASFEYGNGTVNTPNTLCGAVPQADALKGEIFAAFPKTGEYKVSYQLLMSRKALDYYMEYLKQLQVMKTETDFKKDYLKGVDLTGCFSDCRDCKEKLGSLGEFSERMKKILLEEDNIVLTTPEDLQWLADLYTKTYEACGLAKTVGKNCTITDACRDQRLLMLKDLTPGGQYMLYDETILLFKERLTNVFVSKIKGNVAITDMVMIKRNGTEQSVLLNSLEESEVLTQWKPEWAYLMLPQHAEYCLLAECESQSFAKNRDREMLQTDEDDGPLGAESIYKWHPLSKLTTFPAEVNYTDFIDKDLNTSTVLSPYNLGNIKPDVIDRVNMFIKNVPVRINGVVTPNSNVSLRQFVNFIVYCNNKPAMVNNQFPYIELTLPTITCYKPLDEWRTFRNLYFAIKQEVYRKPGSKSTSETCKNCFIGVNAFSSTYSPKADPNYYPKLNEFRIEENSSHTGLEVIYNQQTPINNRCDVFIAKASIVGGTVTVVPVETLQFQENGSNVLPIAVVNMNEKGLYFIEHITNNYHHNIDGISPNTVCPNTSEFTIFVPYQDAPVTINYIGNHPLLTKTTVHVEIHRYSNAGGAVYGYKDVVFDPLQQSYTEQLFPQVRTSGHSVLSVSCGSSLASCPQNIEWPRYFQKVRRFYESNDVDDIQTVLEQANNGSGTNPMGGENYQQNAEDLSEGWLEVLKGCLDPNDPQYIQKRADLKAGLIAVCVKGSDMLHPFGSSTTPDNTVSTLGDNSFTQVIKRVFNLTEETPTCSALLIDFPLPYNSKSPINDAIITKLSACGYALLTRFKTEWQNAGGPNTLYPTLRDYIRKKYDPNFYLTDKQMEELLTTYVSGCEVKRPFKIPGLLTRCEDPKTPTCLKCTQLYNVQQQFHAAYPQFPETLENYYELLAGYINQVYQMHISATALHTAIDKCKAGGIYNDGCGNMCNEVIASLQKFYQVMPLSEYYNKVSCQELNCEDVLAVFKTHITTWLNLTLSQNKTFEYYYENYFDSCAAQIYQEPGCYYLTKQKQGIANVGDPCQCPSPNILRCCDTYPPFVTFRNLYPNPVDPRLMAFFFEMRRYTVCAPTNLPNISYTQPYNTLVSYFNNITPTIIPNCGGGGSTDKPIVANKDLKSAKKVNKNSEGISNVHCGPYSFSGNVWHDINGMSDGYVNNSGGAAVPPAANVPANLYVYMVDGPGAGYITNIATVNTSTGAFSFPSFYSCSNQVKLYLSAVVAGIEDDPPATTLPAGWEHTGQHFGTTAGDDGLNDGILVMPVNNNYVGGYFGIRTTGSQTSCSSIWQFTFAPIQPACPNIYDPVFGPGDFVLCSQPLTPVYTSDSNECIRSMVNATLANAEYAYSQYVKDFMRDYREAYFAKCLSITPSLVMEGNQQEYHYTLYYYDQSGNLVKTIPPKGVTYLTPNQIADVGRLRDEDNGECYKNSIAPTFAGANQSLTVPAGFYPQHNAGALTVEAWVKFADINSKQLILNQFDDGGTGSGKAGYYAYIENGKLTFNIFGRSQETWEKKQVHWLYQNLLPDVQAHFYDYIQDEPRTRAFRATCSTENLITSSGPAGDFYHIVFQYSGDPNDKGPVKIYVNGILQTLNWTSGGNGYEYKFLDNLVDVPYTPIPAILETKYELKTINNPFTTASVTPLVAGSTTRTVNGVSINGISGGSMKQLRIYNNAPDAADLRRGSYDACYMPAAKNGLVLWLPLNKQTGGFTEDVQSGDNVSITATWVAPAEPKYPNHNMPTYYAYNSLNQVTHQETPDAGQSNFWYDRLGRLVVSQNAEQKIPSNGDQENRYSYTVYDAQGRISEVGEKTNVADISTIDTRDTLDLKTWLGQGADRQLTKTIYDNPDPYITTDPQILLEQLHHYNSRKRVVTSVYIENKGAPDDYNYASHYIYDISGNVKKLYQENRKLPNGTDVSTTKTLDYEFDLISGKVNQVWYQKTKQDQYLYRYTYDPDNRLIDAQTGRDEATLRYDARYMYHLHGPLARTELGHEIVQGIDYAYTLQGWMKGINGLFLNEPGSATNYDLGGDGVPGTDRAWIPNDVYGYTLGYFNNDYTPIDDRGGQHPISQMQFGFNTPASIGITGNQLFNGNIAYTTYANRMLGDIPNGDNPLFPYTYSYQYDQLNRLTEMRNHEVYGPGGSWNSGTIREHYSESAGYDANGNILSYQRNAYANQFGVYDMDNLNYNYPDPLINNKLGFVSDGVDPGYYTEDIDGQGTGNYQYDKIGNLISDNSVDNKINEIKWTVYGKIRSITKDDGTLIEYAYDPAGNRVSKIVTTSIKGQPSTQTYYFRDATGNTMAVYEGSPEKGWTWKEQDLYGSSRLGMWKPDMALGTGGGGGGDDLPTDGGGGVGGDLPPPTDLPQTTYDETVIGTRHYELTNHLGNVMSTITDMKTGVSINNDDVINYYIADVVTANDYYPFGMAMPGRKYDNGSGYRYGFNGKENDKEVKGEGNQQDYGMRIYDTRLGRFLSVDPLTPEYPELTPYQFASNTPIQAIDLDGLEAFFIHGTNSNSSRWTATPSAKKAVQAVLKVTNNKYYNTGFNWKARLLNNEKSRAKAARQLADYVMANKVDGEEITLVGHSHGGNVAIQAAKLIYEKTGQKVNIVTIAVPAHNGKGDAENPETQKNYINDHIALWNAIDGVSGGVAGDDYYTNSTVTTNVELKVDKYYVTERETTDRWGRKSKIKTEDNVGAHSADVEHPDVIENAIKDKSLKKLKPVPKKK